MTAMTALPLPRGRAFTRADLDGMPDDGHRYELIDGILLVSPSPSHRHQRAAARLFTVLQAAITDDHSLEVLFAPFDVVLGDDTIVQPDLLIARAADFTAHDLPVPPLLAVEVLSPSSRRIDRLLKHGRYAAAGVQHYWVVDPDGPSLTAWALGADGSY